MAENRGTEFPLHDTAMTTPSDREIVLTRTFRAPPRLVFEAWTQPEFVKRWWAPKSRCVEIVECRADVQVGGAYRYVLRAEGNEIGFNGKYVEINRYTRLVYTQIFEPFPDSPLLITVTFEEHEGKTRLRSHELYPTKEARDATIAAGMEHGMRETMNQLDDLVASLH
ncbi:SRPBCC family protein [Myxococcus sp. K15C18031901]|uniref:SRPBCC family protein n=1 Tax=Myxococcus dinghuensis TaxID=2906761 RepID=UPI0020A7283D|nr:SRPBCC family protein [Myxococcus dinghuensis]MCP3097992.1 SRPBCC family protein [Myxococcus dinghuensis]